METNSSLCPSPQEDPEVAAQELRLYVSLAKYEAKNIELQWKIERMERIEAYVGFGIGLCLIILALVIFFQSCTIFSWKRRLPKHLQ